MIKHDLNVNKTLTEQWSKSDAIKELITNAIDESKLSKTKFPEIEYNNSIVTITDYGRGILPDNFINNENTEKINSDEVIGFFGVGMKDSINVLENNKSKVTIISIDKKYTFFKDIKPMTDSKTLFCQEEKNHEKIIGTKVYIDNISKDEYELALSKFLKFNKLKSKFSNKIGEIIVLEDQNQKNQIYYRGVLIHENDDDDFYYSYNIKLKSKALQKNMNRERSNISKSVITPEIQKILKNFNKEEFLNLWFDPYVESTKNGLKNELTLKPILEYAEKFGVKFISQNKFNDLENSERNFFLEEDYLITNNPNFIPDLVNKRDGEVLIKQYLENNSLAKKNWNISMNWLKIIYFKKYYSKVNLNNIYVCESIIHNSRIATGMTEGENIFLDKNIFKNKFELFITLIHELIHLLANHGDETREFEKELENNFEYLLREYDSKLG